MDMKEGLAKKQKQFQARVMRRLAGEEIPGDEVEEESRSALGLLRGHGKGGRVGSVRVGSARLGPTPGPLPTGHHQRQPLGTNNGRQEPARPGFSIFTDTENSVGAGAPVQLSHAQASLPGSREAS